MDIMAAIGAVSQGITVAKTLRGVEKAYDDATYKIQISDLICALTDAKLALSEAREAMAQKDQEIERLKNAFQLKVALWSGPGGYNYITKNGCPDGFPVCPKCEVEGRIIQIKQDGGHLKGKCPSCGNVYLPVTCFIGREVGGPTTLEKEYEANRAAQAVRSNEAIRRAARKLA